jgi:predicted GNAT family N-acyltransferase
LKISIKYFNTLPEDSRAIRMKVFVDEQGFEEEFDTQDNSAIHFLAYSEDNTAIGTCRIFEAEIEGEYYLGRLAVLLEFRGKNVGTHLLSAAEEYIRSKNGFAVRLHSQLQAKQFYEKCGYIAFGEIDFEEDCPHIWMKKFLK